MWSLALIPFFLQAIVIGVDEAYFHYKRGLPKWEKIGHPIDTFSILICMLFVLFVPFSSFTLKLYVALAILSSIVVTKDEFVHKHFCLASENWLHALLYTLHPITLASAGFIWPVVQGIEVPSWLSSWLGNPAMLHKFLYLQATAIFLFLLYQIVFWNVIWKEKVAIKQ